MLLTRLERDSIYVLVVLLWLMVAYLLRCIGKSVTPNYRPLPQTTRSHAIPTNIGRHRRHIYGRICRVRQPHE